jgi:predicted phage terminase large subunit-like protein
VAEAVNGTFSRADLEAALDPRTQEFQQLVRLTPATLAHYRTRGRWIAAPHLLHVASILATELTRGDARIIVELPPRHGKSELISINTPIWFLDHFPWANVILTTYAAELSVEFGRRVRDAFLENENGVLRPTVRDDAQKMSMFLTSEGGGMRSVGIGGPITGKGAHLLLVDDYIKNWEEASSPKTLEDIFNWFITTAYTRLEPGGSCVILATRWVIDDLIGRLIEADKENFWTVIRLPALAEPNDPLGRPEGEALWPKRYSTKSLNSIKKILGEFMFSALYQQAPKKVTDSKADISKIKEIAVVPHGNFRWCRSWDLAATEKDSTNKADWTVGTLIGTNSVSDHLGQTIIADQVRGQWNPDGVEEQLLKTAQKDGPMIPIIIEQEPGSSGKSWALYLKNTLLKGYHVEIKPSGGSNKWIRAQPYIAAITDGRVSFVVGSWNKAHKEELRDFPNSKYDDTVDSASLGFAHLHLTNMASPIWGRTPSGLLVPQQALSEQPVYASSVVWGR